VNFEVTIKEMYARIPCVHTSEASTLQPWASTLK